MSFKFKRHESIATGIHRVLGELLDDCARLLRQGGGDDVDAAVHDTRRALKRARAVLRLLVPHIARSDFRALDRPLRNCGRSLAAPRDAKVVHDTFAAILEKVTAESDREALSSAIAPHLMPDTAVLRPVSLKRLAGRLTKVRGSIDDLHIPKSGWGCIGPGLERMYRKCQAAAAVAAESRQVEDLHQWRKTTKHLWHQVQLLRAAWPELLNPLTSEFSRLANLLGTAHDHAVLEDCLRELPAEVAESAEIVLEATCEERLVLERDAISLGARLLAEQPHNFEQRLHSIWKAWKAKK